MKGLKTSSISDLTVDIAEVCTAEGRLSPLVANVCACNFAYAEQHEEARNMIVVLFLAHLIAPMIDKTH